MALLPSLPPREGLHLLFLTATLLVLTLLCPSEAQHCGGDHQIGTNLTCECLYMHKLSATASVNDSTATPYPEPEFRWLLKSHSYYNNYGEFRPIDDVLDTRNIHYNNDATKSIMSTVLLTQNHEGTYKCECVNPCPNVEILQDGFDVEIDGGLVVYDDNFKVVARTEARRRGRYHYSWTHDDGSVEVGTTLHCTSSYGNFNRNNRYCMRFTYRNDYLWNRKCFTVSPTFTELSDSVTSQLECLVWEYNGFFLHYGPYPLSTITIHVVRREAPNVEECKANATELELTFDAAAYQDRYGDLTDMEVVITLPASSSDTYHQNITEPYKSSLDQFTVGITLAYYVLYDGQQTKTRYINLDSECGRPHVLHKRKCHANLTILYLELGEYGGSSNRTVLEIKNSTGVEVKEYPSDKTEFWIPGDVKKVVYYAVFDDGQESLKVELIKDSCKPPPPPSPTTQAPTTRSTPRSPITFTSGYTKGPDQLTLTVSISAAVCGVALIVLGGILLIGCIYTRVSDMKEKKAAALAAAMVPAKVRHIVRYRHNVLLHAPFTNDALVSERVVNLREFRQYVKQSRRDNCSYFRKEFASLANDHYSELSIMFGKMAMPKNRYSNIIPYDHNRVIISGETDEDAYVNASFINGYNLPHAYIAAQGPLPQTVSDFWEMVWVVRCRRLVMLTRVEEDGTRKCEKYWPDSNEDPRCRPGRDLTVELKNVERFDDYEIRDYFVTKDDRPYDEPLPVRWFHFLAWPDHGVPMYPTGILRFMQEVKKHEQEYITPTIVHCSAGVGRTGTYIALDYCIDRLADTSLDSKIIEIYGLVQILRLQRAHMVQTADQYIFIHDALLEYTYSDSRFVTPDKLVAILKAAKPKDKKSTLTGFENEFEFMKEVSRKFSMVDQTVWLQHGSENRYANRCPYKEGYLDVLDQRGQVEKEYINATMVDGWKQEKTYVAAQTPMAHSVDHFWSTILWDFDIHSVVVLADFEEKGKDTCYKFWPDKEFEPEVFGFVGVVLKSVTKYASFTSYTCDIRNEAMRKMKSREVVIFHYTKWPEEGRPAASFHIVEMIEQLDNVQESSGNPNGRILVSCNDGMGRTGSFLAMHRELQRLKFEGVVSVFQSARALRGQRPSLIRTPEQYAAVYEVIAEYHQPSASHSKKERVLAVPSFLRQDKSK